MPVIVARNFPLPSLQTYVAFCLAVLSSCLFYAFYRCKGVVHVTQQSAEANASNTSEHRHDIDTIANLTADLAPVAEKSTTNAKSTDYLAEGQLICTILSSDGWAVFLVINFAYCLMFLAGKLIQHVVFGNLRAVERQHLRERFWNFVFYKFVFLFGILNVQAMFTFICWLGWFTVLGLAHIGLQLCFDRFEFVANNPSTPRSVYAKLIGLVLAIFFVAVFLIGASFWAYFTILAGLNLLAFMLAESLMLFIRITYVVTRIVIHFKDTTNSSGTRWEDKDIVVYYVNLTADLLLYAIDLGNHVHMLLWGNAFLSVTSLIIFLQIRQLYNEFTHRLRRHLAWVQVVRSIDRCLISVSQSCIDPSEQVCSICWETMTNAKRLPCNHLFHATCLRSWLDYDMTCPVCRLSLHKFLLPSTTNLHASTAAGQNSQTLSNTTVGDNNANNSDTSPQTLANANATLAAENRIVRRRFTINASRYISWIPNLSVEVRATARSTSPMGQPPATANSGGGANVGTVASSSPVAAAAIHSMQLDAMAAQVRAVLPQVPLTAIIGDLQLSGSAEQTIDNILEGRLGPFADLASTRNRQHSLSSAAGDSDDDSDEESSSNISDGPPLEDAPNPTNLSATNFSDPITDLRQQDPLALLSLSNPEHETVVKNNSSSMVAPAIGGRFSKDPSERHRLLAIRKLQFLAIAKQRFVYTSSPDQPSPLEEPQ